VAERIAVNGFRERIERIAVDGFGERIERIAVDGFGERIERIAVNGFGERIERIRQAAGVGLATRCWCGVTGTDGWERRHP
jgi:hypothetical protein